MKLSTKASLLIIGIVVVMFVWGAKVFFHMNRPPDDAMTVSVVGKRWMWKLQHPTGQREINELHVPVGRAVKLVITSEDVIHSFFVPAFRIKKDAVPGRYNVTLFPVTSWDYGVAEWQLDGQPLGDAIDGYSPTVLVDPDKNDPLKTLTPTSALSTGFWPRVQPGTASRARTMRKARGTMR